MEIKVLDASGHVEFVSVVGYSPSRSRHTLKWLERCVRREHKSFFAERERFWQEWEHKPPFASKSYWSISYGDGIWASYYPDFWSEITYKFGEEITGSGARIYRMRIAGRWIRFRFT